MRRAAAWRRGGVRTDRALFRTSRVAAFAAVAPSTFTNRFDPEPRRREVCLASARWCVAHAL